ncbi:hypothetical protein FTX61_04070 [Nitriliruptoraceae bacterium ZYF776]|nr:hypothetical protein [Profundirhabdus halotolerans]
MGGRAADGRGGPGRPPVDPGRAGRRLGRPDDLPHPRHAVGGAGTGRLQRRRPGGPLLRDRVLPRRVGARTHAGAVSGAPPRRDRVALALLRLVDRLLQQLVAVRADRVCWLSIPDATDNARALWRHTLRTRRGIDHVWLVADPHVEAALRTELAELTADRPDHGHRLTVRRKGSVRGYLAHLSSRWVFHTHGAYAFSDAVRGRRQVVALWHGMPIKAIGRLNRTSPNPRPTFATASIATSQLWRYVVASAFGLDAHEVWVTGAPRCDVFDHPEARATDAATVRARLEVGADQPLLVWLPTYRTQVDVGARGGPTSGRTFVDDLPAGTLAALQAAAEARDAVVVVKLHPMDVLNRGDAAAAVAAAGGGDRLRVLRADDWRREGIQLYDLLAASDALLSDVSSVVVDYLATDRPIGIVGFDPTTYDRERLLPVDALLASARFHRLEDAEVVAGFVAAAADRRPVHAAPGDLAAALYDRDPEPAAERVLRAAGFGPDGP